MLRLMKYLILAIIVYLLFKFVPNNPMDDKDIILIATIVVLTYAVVENIHTMYMPAPASIVSSQCPVVSCPVVSCPSCPANSSAQNEGFGSIGNILQDSEAKVIKKEQSKDENAQLIMGQQQTQSQSQSQQEQNHTMYDMAGNLISLKQEQNQLSNSTNLTPPPIHKNPDGSYNIPYWKSPQAVTVGSRSEEGVMKDLRAFNYTDYNSLPVTGDNTGSFELGYSFLPPSMWFPLPPRAPICVSEKICQVCPTYTNTDFVNVLEWDSSRRISQPDEINVKYIEEVLNAGR